MRAFFTVEWGFRLISGIVFIYAGINKIGDPCSMALDIYNYQILPTELINVLAITLPMMELVFGTAIIIGIGHKGAALGVIILLCIFTTGIGLNLVRGIDMACGCFGSSKDLCVSFSDWLSTKFSGISKLLNIRIRLGCDIFRDLVLLIIATGALLLSLQRSMSKQKAQICN